MFILWMNPTPTLTCLSLHLSIQISNGLTSKIKINQMKNIALVLFAFIALMTMGCEKDYQGDSYDFSDAKAPYVEFASKKAITATQGTTISPVVQMRTALTEDVTVNYTLSINTTIIPGSVTIARNSLKATAPI